MTDAISKAILNSVLVLFVVLFVHVAANGQNYTPEEQNCYSMVQGKVAWDKASNNKTWGDDNIRALCRGTSNAALTISCFSAKIAADVRWNQAIPACSAEAMKSAVDLSGSWTPYDSNGKPGTILAKITQNGPELILDNGVGSRAVGRLTGVRITTDWQVTGILSDNTTKISWSNNTNWVKTSTPGVTVQTLDLNGKWTMYNPEGMPFDNLGTIVQTGSTITTDNGYGARATSTFIGNTITAADGTKATVSADGNRIDWLAYNVYWERFKSLNLDGTWEMFTAEGKRYDRQGTIIQNGSNLATDNGYGARNNAILTGNKITIPGSSYYGIVTLEGAKIVWVDNGVWRKQTTDSVPALKAFFLEGLQKTMNAEIEEIDGPRKDAVGSGEISAGSHINGMALVGDWFIVNYPNFDGEKGRLLFWNLQTKKWANVVSFGLASQDSSRRYGYPACMDASGNYVVVGTGESGFVKVFNFSNPQNGITELTNLELNLGGNVENVGLAFDPVSRKYLLYANNKFFLSTGNIGENLSSDSGWEAIDVSGGAIPFGEAGSPLRYLGGNLFAILSLGSDKNNDSYAFKASFARLTRTSGKYAIVRELNGTAYTFKNPGEAGGAPSFRWAGTARVQKINGEFIIDLYAAPKRLDASGNYYRWSGK